MYKGKKGSRKSIWIISTWKTHNSAWLHLSLRSSPTWRLWGQGARQVYSRLPGRSKHPVPGGHELLARAQASTSISQFCPTNPKKERMKIILKSRPFLSPGGKSHRRQVNSKTAHKVKVAHVNRSRVQIEWQWSDSSSRHSFCKGFLEPSRPETWQVPELPAGTTLVL